MVFCNEPNVGMYRYQIDLRLAGKLRHPSEPPLKVLESFGNRSIQGEIVAVEPQEEEAVADRRRMMQGEIQTVTAERCKGVDAGRHQGRHPRGRTGQARVKAQGGFDPRLLASGIPVTDHSKCGQEPIAQLGTDRSFDLNSALSTVHRRHRACQQERVGIGCDVLSERCGALEMNLLARPVGILPGYLGGNPHSPPGAVRTQIPDSQISPLWRTGFSIHTTHVSDPRSPLRTPSHPRQAECTSVPLELPKGTVPFDYEGMRFFFYLGARHAELPSAGPR